MPLRSRHGPPPYQVMKSYPPSPPYPPSAPTSASDSTPAGAAANRWSRGAANENFWQRLNQSIAFRMTRGQLTLILLVMLMLILLAYWVGHSLGYRQANAEQAADNASVATPENLGAAQSIVPPHPSLSASSSLGEKPAPVKLVKLPGKADARQTGLSYFVMIVPTEAYGTEILTFLAKQNGIDTQAITGNTGGGGVDAQVVQRHNGRSFKLVFLRGFSANQLDQPDCRNYQQTILRLGRLWKAANRNHKDFAGIYLEDYRNEPVSLVITKEKRS